MKPSSIKYVVLVLLNLFILSQCQIERFREMIRKNFNQPDLQYPISDMLWATPKLAQWGFIMTDPFDSENINVPVNRARNLGYVQNQVAANFNDPTGSTDYLNNLPCIAAQWGNTFENTKWCPKVDVGEKVNFYFSQKMNSISTEKYHSEAVIFRFLKKNGFNEEMNANIIGLHLYTSHMPCFQYCTQKLASPITDFDKYKYNYPGLVRNIYFTVQWDHDVIHFQSLYLFKTNPQAWNLVLEGRPTEIKYLIRPIQPLQNILAQDFVAKGLKFSGPGVTEEEKMVWVIENVFFPMFHIMGKTSMKSFRSPQQWVKAIIFIHQSVGIQVDVDVVKHIVDTLKELNDKTVVLSFTPGIPSNLGKDRYRGIDPIGPISTFGTQFTDGNGKFITSSHKHIESLSKYLDPELYKIDNTIESDNVPVVNYKNDIERLMEVHLNLVFRQISGNTKYSIKKTVLVGTQTDLKSFTTSPSPALDGKKKRVYRKEIRDSLANERDIYHKLKLPSSQVVSAWDRDEYIKYLYG